MGARGFTLVELVTVLVLIGALAVLALPRLLDRATVQAAGLEQELRAALRHGRSLALAAGCPVQVRITPSEYGVYLPADATGTDCGSGPFTQAVPRPARGEPYQGPVPAGLDVGTLTVTFDALGRTGGGSLTVGTRTITVSGAGYVE